MKTQAQQIVESYNGGSLDLRGCDLKGVTLPATVGGWLYLSGCDLTGVTLPSTVGGSLDLRGCDLTGVTLPKVIFGQPGQMIAFEGKYLLWRSDAGLYYAGCRIALTREQALKHWDRQDDRAVIFTKAIKEQK